MITKLELDKIKTKKYLGSSISSLMSLIDKIKNIGNTYNNIVALKGNSFHNPSCDIWLVKSEEPEIDMVSKLRNTYKEIIEEEVSLFGLSRKTNHFDYIVNSMLNKI